MDVRTFARRNNRFLASAEPVRFGCGHSSTRGGSGAVVESSSTGRIVARLAGGRAIRFPAALCGQPHVPNMVL